MTARQLYDEARRRYPEAKDIFATVSCQDVAGGKILEVWTVLIHDKLPGDGRVLTHSGHGYTPEQCLANLKEVTQ